MAFQCHQICLGKPTSTPLLKMHLRNLASFLEPFSPCQLLTMYKSQIRPSLEYFSHVWGGAPSSSLHLLDIVQPKAIRLVNNPSLTTSLQSLSHHRLVADLSIFYRFFHAHCSLEIKNIIPDPLKHVRPSRSCTESHPFQVTLSTARTLSHKFLSCQKPVNFGPPYLPLPFLNPITYRACNLTSTNFISSPYLLSFLSSFLSA